MATKKKQQPKRNTFLTLRDLFAAAALVGHQIAEQESSNNGTGVMSYEDVAESCFFQADEMMRVRDE